MVNLSTGAASAHWRLPLLGLDISLRRIGVALAEGKTNVYPLFTYLRVKRAADVAKCVEWACKYQAGGVVIGLPVNMDGSPSDQSRWTEGFAGELRGVLDIPILLQDERQSTMEADELLESRGLDRKRRETEVDSTAAAIILRRFLAQEAENIVAGGAE